jgi:DNA (cytosine-5)-methyltransferase 1
MELFENAKKAKMCHVRWFQHGAKTILQETAHPLELFATNQCDDQPLHFVSGKCQVRQRLPGEEEPQYNPAEENNFFYRSVK